MFLQIFLPEIPLKTTRNFITGFIHLILQGVPPGVSQGVFFISSRDFLLNPSANDFLRIFPWIRSNIRPGTLSRTPPEISTIVRGQVSSDISTGIHLEIT